MARLDLPSLRQLRVFEAVARLESISAASKVVHLSQPGVTQGISGLEQRIKVSLFDRRRTGCYLTRPGAIFLPRVQRLLAQVRQALCEPTVGTPLVGRDLVAALENRLTGAHMRSLIAVSDSGSFDGAARRLGISQPSLHRSARDLERALRRTLYRRTAQGLTTTAHGGELARRFKIALREIEYGIEELNAAQGRFISRIAIGNIPHSETHVLSKAVNAFLAAYPGAYVQILDGHYEELLAGLRAGQLDILFGVLRRPAWAVDVEEELLFSNPYAVVARRGHPITMLSKPRVRDLARYEWMTPSEGAPRRQAFEKIFAGVCAPPKVSIETTSMEIYKSVLEASDRLALLPQRDVRMGKTAELAVLPFRSPALSRFDGVATRTDWKPTSIHLQFLQKLRQYSRA